MNIDDAKECTPYELEMIRLLSRIAKSLESLVDQDAK